MQKPTTIANLVNAALTLLCALCLSACSQNDELGVDEGNPGDCGVLLSFCEPGKEGRSQLTSSEVNYKDVKTVHLLIFDGDTLDAKCILNEDIHWKGDITQKYWVTTSDLKAGNTYTYMAIGIDDKTSEVYGLPHSIGDQTTLKECMAKLTETLDPQVPEYSEKLATCKKNMAQAQFFVGTTTKVMEGKVAEVAITMQRKVAGILVYLRNIPVNVVMDNNNQPVKKLQVRLHADQNTQLSLWKENPESNVFGKEPLKESKVLFELDLKAAGFTADGEYYRKDYHDTIPQLDDTYLAGAYLLPIENTPNSSTLSVDLIGTYTNNVGESTENHILKSYEVKYKTPEGKLTTTFDIKENTLYAIGQKLSSSSTDSDIPADLSGKLLLLNVLPWDTVHLNNVFPTVTGPARIEADFNDEKYVFDASKSSFDFIIKPAVDKDPNTKKQWTLSVNYVRGNEEFKEKTEDWIHFKTYNAEGEFVGYTNTLTGYGEMVVTAVINDYAVQRKLEGVTKYTSNDIKKFKNDIRRAQLELKTDGVTDPYRLQVQQYNTLTIYSPGDKRHHNKGKGFRGIARLDHGYTFDKETGDTIGSDSIKIQWGYFTTGNKYVSGDNPMDYVDGENTSDHCFKRMRGGAWGSHAYWGSAIQRLTRRFINIKTITNDKGNKEVVDMNPAETEKQGEKNWYLPAYYEMWGVSETFGEHYEALGKTLEEAYWTSSGDNGWYKDAYIAKIGVPEESMQRDKDNYYHAMFMVHFDEQQP